MMGARFRPGRSMQRERLFPAVANSDLLTWAITAALLLLLLHLKMLSALLAGLLVYELVHVLANRLKLSSISRNNAKLVSVALLTGTVVVLLILVILGLA